MTELKPLMETPRSVSSGAQPRVEADADCGVVMRNHVTPQAGFKVCRLSPPPTRFYAVKKLSRVKRLSPYIAIIDGRLSTCLRLYLVFWGLNEDAVYEQYRGKDKVAKIVHVGWGTAKVERRFVLPSKEDSE